MLRLLTRIFGVALLISGCLWMLQGLGLVMWPAESFMIGQREWATYGLIAVVTGLLLIWMTRRNNRES